MLHVLNRWNYRIKKLAKEKYPYTNVVGLSRSVLAVGTLLTLTINSSKTLIFKPVSGNPINPLLEGHLSEFNFFLIFGYEGVDVMRYLGVVFLLIVISGYFIKITSIIHWWITYSFLTFSSAIDGGDHIASVITLFLIPICLTDPRKNHWSIFPARESPYNLIAIFSILLIRLQVAVIYFHSFAGKFFVPEWANGTALYYWLNQSFFGMPLYISDLGNNLLANGFVVVFVTYGSLLIEILLFLCLFSKDWLRKIMFPVGLAFHFGIIYFLGIFSFFFSMAACLIIYLLPFYKPLKYVVGIGYNRTKNEIQE